MKKHIANIVSLSRVAGAIILFFCKDISALFLSVYVFCGFTDLIDGPIARKTDSIFWNDLIIYIPPKQKVKQLKH
jgi:CDP-diacylglycerol--glycerol-3-phosphate 3-phosphatidyltransferase